MMFTQGLHSQRSSSPGVLLQLYFLFSPGVCDVDLKNKTGYTAVMLVSLQQVETDTDIKVVQQLMELGDVNARAGQVSSDGVLAEIRFHADVEHP